MISTTQFPRSFEESNPIKKQAIEQWLLQNVDDSQQRKQHVICFLNTTSFYLTSLPDAAKWHPELKSRVMSVIVDHDMKEDLVKAGLINWCRNVRSLLPVTVPRDGNCLLHAVAVAVWGVRDNSLMLRRLLCLALGVDQEQRFRSRWLHSRQTQIAQFVNKLLQSGAQLMEQEWQEVRQCLEPEPEREGARSMAGEGARSVAGEGARSVAVPHRFLEPIHVYALSNLLRRPILVLTDPSARALTGRSLQDNDMGGVYLPLEWSWADTCRSPVLLGYSHSHFCPLLFGELPNKALKESSPRRDLVALVNREFEQLPVRFLLQGEEPEVGHLLRKYLKVRETVMQVNGRVQNVLCAEVEVTSLPAGLDIVADYIQDCAQRFHQEGRSLPASPRLSNPAPPPQGSPAVRHTRPAQGVPHSVRREQLQGMPSPEYGLGDPTLHASGLGPPQINIPPPSLAPVRSSGEQSVGLNPPRDKMCIVPSCKFFGDPDLAMMCSRCFRNYTIRESRHMTSAGSNPPLSAPLASVVAPEVRPLISMMDKKCKENCGYFCSTTTFPYCHECAGKRQRQAQETAMASALELAGGNPGDDPTSLAVPSPAPGPQAPEEGGEEACGTTARKRTSEVQGSSPAGQPSAGGTPRDPTEVATPQLVHKASPLPTAHMTEEAWTRTMVTGEPPCPEAGPEDPSPQLLFGSGQTPAESSGQLEQGTSATGGEPQVTPSTDLTSPASGGVTSPASGGVTSPASGEGVTSPASGEGVTSPASGGVTSPASGGGVASPASGEGVTSPASGGGVTSPASGGGVTSPASGGVTSPACGRAPDFAEPEDPGLVAPPASGTAAPTVSEAEAGEVSQTPQQTPPPPPPPDRQQQQLGAPEEGEVTSAHSLAKTPTPAPAVWGAEAKAVCSSPGCSEPGVHQSLCPKCYVGQDVKNGEAASLTEKAKMMTSLQSTSSSAPASVSPAAATAANASTAKVPVSKEADVFTLPQSRSQPSSLRDLTQIPAMNYTQNWIYDIRFAESVLTQQPSGAPQGLPEKAESERSGTDLIVSGAQCFSSTQRCVGCGSAVPRAGTLCPQCEHILRHARQEAGAAAAAQAEQGGPRQPECLSEGCSFYGLPQNMGYCSRCYGRHVEREVQPGSHHGGSAGRWVPIPPPSSTRSITVPADFTYMYPPQDQQGQPCMAAGCQMFGDPKHAGMCFAHYQQHLSNIAKATRHVPVATRRPNVTPSSATVFRQGNGFPPPRVSVPPPPLPSGPAASSAPQGPSLGETYYRVAGRPKVKCLNPVCNNYGNGDKGGLCNSCAHGQRASDELISSAIYGDEEIG
ncbi:hypothetical protein ACOMHN_008931 [Nucella lapillus]